MDAARLWKFAARLFAVIALALGCVLPFLRWVPQFDFDILGFAWVLTNAHNLACWIFFIMFACMAVYCRIRAQLA